MNTYPLTQENRDQELKYKWTTFTYFGPVTGTITNLFQSTNLRISYKTANTLKHHLKSKETPRDIYSQKSIYQLQCKECLLKYAGQTGRPF
jgi:hypothetical protein